MRLLALTVLLAFPALGVAQEQPQPKTLLERCVDLFRTGEIYKGSQQQMTMECERAFTQAAEADRKACPGPKSKTETESMTDRCYDLYRGCQDAMTVQRCQSLDLWPWQADGPLIPREFEAVRARVPHLSGTGME